MSEVDQNPTRQVLPRPTDPCRRCEHPFSEHIGDTPSDATPCRAELSPGRVPSTALGGTCPCPSFVFEPATEAATEAEATETLDGPAMYAEGLGYLRLARAASNEYAERAAMERAAVHFAGAAAAAMGAIVAENGTGDLAERRWRAALDGADSLPEEGE